MELHKPEKNERQSYCIGGQETEKDENTHTLCLTHTQACVTCSIELFSLMQSVCATLMGTVYLL